MKQFEFISHTADLEICVYGKDEKELFKNALIGMFQSIKPVSNKCVYKDDLLICKNLPINREIKINAPDLEILLIDFLSEALYLSDTNNEAYLNADIHELDSNFINATLKGIKVDGFEVVEIKAVTYHKLQIKREDNYLKTHIVFDI